jgi:hypothetical protein
MPSSHTQMPLCLSAEVLCSVLHNLHRSDHHHTDSVLTQILAEHLAVVESHCSGHRSELPKNTKIVQTLEVICCK